MGVKGKIIKIAGPVVVASGMSGVKMYEVVRVGNERLIGEVIELDEDKATIQVYEETSGIAPGAQVESTGHSLSVELGPGIIGNIYDGIMRPLNTIQEKSGHYIARGIEADPIDHKRKWKFTPKIKKGDKLVPGQVIGEVIETSMVTQKIMVPPKIEGTVTQVAEEGEYTVTDTIAKVSKNPEGAGEENLTLMQKWPVRIPRPSKSKKEPVIPLVTGQRILDTFNPVAKGGTAAIPGGFGTGKCVTGDTPILADNYVLPIEKVFNLSKYSNAANIEENSQETIVKLNTPLKVQTFDGEKIREAKATHVYKGKTNKIVKIRTHSGRMIKLTPAHRLFRVSESLGAVETPAAELKVGDYILSPRANKLEVQNSKLVLDVEVLDGEVLDVDNEYDNFNSFGNQTIVLLQKDVFHDKIKEIEMIDGEADVYDLTVPETHNFIGGEIPMILHNTVTQQSLAKWSDADIIVYIGCGERGNEMTDVLRTFPALIDPKSGKPLLERTVIIANTSNMPVAAREASVYTGITIAEYFRDMGYDVALMADSTSRWAEAMREISSRLEEMPGEEGYPAYLATRLSQFYERSGRVETLNGDEGSVSIIGAISPPGGDFSEPVTQNTLRVNKTFWALDKNLASRRHFPAINWLNSYSLYLENVTPWFNKNAGENWRFIRDNAMSLLQKEEKLQEIVQLVGPDALPDSQRLILEATKIIREDFLQQNAYHDVDAFCPVIKQYLMLKLIIEFYDKAQIALEKNASIESISKMKSKELIARMKEQKNETFQSHYNKLAKDMENEFTNLR